MARTGGAVATDLAPAILARASFVLVGSRPGAVDGPNFLVIALLPLDIFV